MFCRIGWRHASVLEAVEAAFDAVAQRTDEANDRDLVKPAPLHRDDGLCVALPQVLADGVAVAALAGDPDLRRGAILFHERTIALAVRGLVGRQDKGNR